MTIIEAASQSRTFDRAWGDLTGGFRKRELWLNLGWQDIKQNPGGNTANKLKNVVSVMKTYIDTTPNKFLFKQLEDGNSVPYLVTDIKYHPPKDYSSAHVTIHMGAHNTYASGGYWGGGRDSGGATISLHDDDYRGKTMGEILKSQRQCKVISP